MAAGDFADLQLNLAKLAGRPTAADLDDDLDLCKQVINEAYLGCYALVKPDGSLVRPPWARQPFGLYFRAPVSATIGITQGSKVVTGYAFSADMVGSTVLIGTSTYTYAGQSGSDHLFVEPALESTGSYGATLYHDAQPVDARSIAIIGKPERKGFGLLSPMSDRETEIRHRSNHSGDFHAEVGAGYYGNLDGIMGGMNFQAGSPLYFRVESTSLVTGATVRDRLVIYPAPSQATVIRFDAHVVPTELSSDSDRPLLKGDLVSRILLPIARGEWAVTYKKFSGEGVTLDALRMGAERARSLLETLGTAQTRGSGRALAGR